MSKPLMPKATALWLIENTALTFQQIADFCGLHVLEVQALADEESSLTIVPFDPLMNQQLTREEISRCEADSGAQLRLLIVQSPIPAKKKGHKYTPLAKRSERPDAIAWLLKNNPELTDKHIMSLLGTTKATIHAVKTRTHRNAAHIKPRCPVTMGLCTQTDLDRALAEVQASPAGEKSEAVSIEA
jgi:hypothetical protein